MTFKNSMFKNIIISKPVKSIRHTELKLEIRSSFQNKSIAYCVNIVFCITTPVQSH